MTRPSEFYASIKRQKWRQRTGADGITRCEQCTAPLRPGKIRFDHILPVELGGLSTIENCQLLCIACDAPKTYGEDIPRIRKADRMTNAYLGHKIRIFRPMPGSRASGIRKRMDGGVVERRRQPSCKLNGE